MRLEPLDLSTARAAIKPRQMPMKRIFEGAQTNRLTADFLSGAREINEDIKSGGEKLRDRARNLVKNNKTAAKYIALLQKNVLGADGITFQSKVMMQRAKGGSLRPNSYVNQVIEAAWAEYGKKGNSTGDHKLSWIDAQSLALASIATDGEILVKLNRGADNPFGFSFDLVDAGRIATSYHRPADGLVCGIQYGPQGRPVQYYVWDRDPNLPGRNLVTLAASDVLHIFEPRFIGQARGISWFAPVMVELHRLEKYIEAELVAAQISANQMGFWKQQLPKDPMYVGEDAAATTTSAGQPVMSEMGSYIAGGPNDELTMFKPEHPVSAFGQFVKDAKMDIAAGLDVAHMSLSGDVGSANYSSARVGLLDERATWESRQWWFVREFCQPIFSAWLEYASLKYAPLRQLAGDWKTLDKAVWHPRPFPWVDPAKDAQAEQLKVQLGFTTRTRVLASQGYDFDATTDEWLDEAATIIDKARSKGIPDEVIASLLTASDTPAPKAQPKQGSGSVPGDSQAADAAVN